MSSTINYKTNSFFTGYSTWGYYGNNGLQNILGNPANNAARKTKNDKLIDGQANYQYQQNNYRSVEPDVFQLINANIWWGQHYFGATAILANQDQFDHGANGSANNRFTETEQKYMMSYAYPLIDNYLAAGLSLNLNQKTVGYNYTDTFSRGGLDLGLSINNLLVNNLSFGFGLKNYGFAQTINNIEYMPDSAWGLGASYRFENNLLVAADYNKYIYSDLYNTSLRGKYDFASSYLNLSPEIIYMLNNNNAGETNQQVGFNLGIGKEFKFDRTVRRSEEVPNRVKVSYSYYELNISQNTIPIKFKKITISKEFNKSQDKWSVTLSAPPLNRTLTNGQKAFVQFELKNESGRKYIFTAEADRNSIHDSISINANLSAGKYQISSYYIDQDRNLLSTVYIDPSPKYIGVCYNISESFVISELTVPRAYLSEINSVQSAYGALYRDYSTCFDSLQNQNEINLQLSAYGTVNAIYQYLNDIDACTLRISEIERQQQGLRDQKPGLEDQLKQLDKNILNTENDQELNNYRNRYNTIKSTIQANDYTILRLEEEKSNNLSKIDGIKREINYLQNIINNYNVIPELIGLTGDDQIQAMVNNKSLFYTREKDLVKEQTQNMRLGRINYLNIDFFNLYTNTRNDLFKIVRTDLENQAKNLDLKQQAFDNSATNILERNNIYEMQKINIADLEIGQSISYLFPFHDTDRSRWIEKRGSFETNYNKLQTIQVDQYPNFVIEQAGLRGDKRLKDNNSISTEIVNYQTIWRDVYQPLYLGLDVNFGYRTNFGTDRDSEYTGGIGITLRGL